MSSPVDTIARHGWTAVPADADAILKGKPYLHKPTSILTKDIPFPSSDPLVARVQAYAKETLPWQTYNHSMRVYYWATTILHRQFPSHPLSLSTLALTALLHDIGTSPSLLPLSNLSFEFHGGIHALNLLQQPPLSALNSSIAPSTQAEAVCEAIIRHQDIGPIGTLTFLGQLIQLATIYDNVGKFEGLVHEDTRVDVNKAFPRGGWSKCFAETIREEVGRKPWAHTTKLGDFEEHVLGNELMREYDGWGA